MENATKALLIAAGVMVAILIISLGISIFNSSSGVTDDASSTLESTAAFTFNKQFSTYFSNSTFGTNAKALTNKILNHNASVNSSKFSPGDHHIFLNFYYKKNSGKKDLLHKWKTADLQQIYSQISNGSRYKIYVTSCDTYPGGYYNGYLICISIREL